MVRLRLVLECVDWHYVSGQRVLRKWWLAALGLPTIGTASIRFAERVRTLAGSGETYWLSGGRLAVREAVGYRVYAVEFDPPAPDWRPCDALPEDYHAG